MTHYLHNDGRATDAMRAVIHTSIDVWNLEPTELTDASRVWDVIGASSEARVVFNCVDERSARTLLALLTDNAHVSGASAKAT